MCFSANLCLCGMECNTCESFNNKHFIIILKGGVSLLKFIFICESEQPRFTEIRNRKQS